MAINNYPTKAQVASALTSALSKQDAYNEQKYATKAETAKLYKVKGSVNSFANLPITGNQEGDVYNVLTTYSTATDMNGTHVKAGDNVVYVDDGNGNSGWDVLGGTTDLTDYSTTAQIETMMNNAQEGFTDAEIDAIVAAANPGITLPNSGE